MQVLRIRNGAQIAQRSFVRLRSVTVQSLQVPFLAERCDKNSPSILNLGQSVKRVTHGVRIGSGFLETPKRVGV